MRFEVLGPVEVRDQAGKAVGVGGGKQLTTLAVLLLSANEWVSAERLIDSLWEEPPPSAAGNVSTYLWGLGRALPPHASGQPRIERGRGRYRLLVDAGELDLAVFRGLAAAGRAASAIGNLAEAVARLREALGLWRGEPLAGIVSAPVRRAATRLCEERWAAEDDLTDLRLDLGEHDELIGELRDLLAVQPTRERRWGQLMLALYRGGRQAEALEAYQQVYRMLDTDVGVEPSTPLQRLHQQILARDPALSLRPAPAGTAVVPAQLPQAVHDFTGRAAALGQLDELSATAAGGAVTVVLTGSAGVGKTALAVYWAHRIAGRFPEGQLHVNLNGFGPGPPLSPERALELMLRGLGVVGTEIPPDLAARAALYRTLLDGRRTLIVLDNAADAGQVRPLLPGAAGCLALVTSRDALTGLVALDGAYRINLGILNPTEALDLLRRLLGVDRVAAEPDAATRLAELCARLPLAHSRRKWR